MKSPGPPETKPNISLHSKHCSFHRDPRHTFSSSWKSFKYFQKSLKMIILQIIALISIFNIVSQQYENTRFFLGPTRPLNVQLLQENLVFFWKSLKYLEISENLGFFVTLLLQACREYLRGNCCRADCRYAHPPENVPMDSDGTVRLCMDAIRGRCARTPCRYYHAPPALTDHHADLDPLPVGIFQQR